MSPRNTKAEQARAIETLRQIQELARDELAHEMGGALTPGTLRSLSYWIARAWEAGNDAERKRKGG